MHTQRILFKWLAIVIAIPMVFLSGLIFPPVSAQGENTPTPTSTPPGRVLVNPVIGGYGDCGGNGITATAEPFLNGLKISYTVDCTRTGWQQWLDIDYEDTGCTFRCGNYAYVDVYDLSPVNEFNITRFSPISGVGHYETYFETQYLAHEFQIYAKADTHSSGVIYVLPQPMPSVQIEVTDSAGNSVNTLSLNSDGWPIPNPLTVKVTLTCPTGGSSCDDYDFNFNLNSGSGSSRFFLYESTIIPNELNCLGDMPGAHNTYGSFELSCDYILFAGQSVSYQWKLWVQPSDTAQLVAQADYGGYSSTKTVSIPKAEIHPVVFVPGYIAFPEPIPNKFYDSLYQTLEKMGYERNKTFFPWFYNPVNSFVDTAEILADEIAQWEVEAVDVPGCGRRLRIILLSIWWLIAPA